MDVSASATSVGVSVAELEARLSEEILHVRRLLDQFCEEIADDTIVLQRHMRSLQNLDRASQTLGQFGTILAASDRLRAAESVKMEDLRTRLLRKANFVNDRG